MTRWKNSGCVPRSVNAMLRNSPTTTSGCFYALQSQPETSVRDFTQHLDPSLTFRGVMACKGTTSKLTLRVGIAGAYFGTAPKTKSHYQRRHLRYLESGEVPDAEGASEYHCAHHRGFLSVGKCLRRRRPATELLQWGSAYQTFHEKSGSVLSPGKCDQWTSIDPARDTETETKGNCRPPCGALRRKWN